MQNIFRAWNNGEKNKYINFQYTSSNENLVKHDLFQKYRLKASLKSENLYNKIEKHLGERIQNKEIKAKA